MLRRIMLLSLWSVASAQDFCPEVSFNIPYRWQTYNELTRTLQFSARQEGRWVLTEHRYTSPYSRVKIRSGLPPVLPCGRNVVGPTVLQIPVLGRSSSSLETVTFSGARYGSVFADSLASRRTLNIARLTSTFEFESLTSFTLADTPSSVAAADINGDGRLDAVGVMQFPADAAGFYIAVQNPDGTFRPPVRTPVAGVNAFTVANLGGPRPSIIAIQDRALKAWTGQADGSVVESTLLANALELPRALAAADMNGDGTIDLLVSDFDRTYISLRAAGGAFGALTPYVERSASSLLILDVNGDSRPDVAGTFSQTFVGVVLGTGTATAGTARFYYGGYLARSLVATDMDGDGKVDLAVGLGGRDALLPNAASGMLQVLFGNGDGSFASASVTPFQRDVTAMALGDVNGDGRRDLAVATQAGLQTVLQTSPGVFGAPIAGPTGFLSKVAVADLNGDGRVEAVAGWGDSVLVFSADTSGRWQAPTTYPLGSRDITGIALGDVNGDSRVDAVVVSQDNTVGLSRVRILLGSGSGTLQLTTTFDTGAYAAGVALVDTNNDRRLDIVAAAIGDVVTGAGGGAFVYRNAGNGTFGAATILDSGVSISQISVGDLNSDGFPDLILSGNAFDVFAGRADGGFGTLQRLPTDFGPSRAVVTDLNRDGVPDLLLGNCCGATDLRYRMGLGNGSFSAERVLVTGLEAPEILVEDLNADQRPDALLLTGGTGGAGAVIVALNDSPRPSTAASVNAASFLGGPAAPASIATLFGTNFTTQTQGAASLPLPTSLGGVEVEITHGTGSKVLAPLFYVSPGQINYLIPASVEEGVSLVRVLRDGNEVAVFHGTFAAVGPGIFSAGPDSLAVGEVSRTGGNTTTREEIVRLNASGQWEAIPIRVAAGERVTLTLFGTGLRGRTNFSAAIRSTSLLVRYSGPQGSFEGLDQVNVDIPSSLAGSGLVEITFQVDRTRTNPVKIHIQ